jgi:RimJ/RimL family protein N-acetyltransferase
VTEIRRATADDAAGVQAVWEAVAAEGEWIGTELPLRANWAAGFVDAVEAPNSIWFVAGEPVVGAIFLRDDGGVAHLGMAIVDGHRSQGLGRRLMNAGISWARERACHKVALEVWPHNERARGLYASAGFVDEGYLRRHYRRRSGALWDVIAMGLLLDETAPGRP